MTALAWIRSKATPMADDTIEFEGATYIIRRVRFAGTVPYRMARELSGSKLENTDTANEYLRVGGQYRSQAGQCEYMRTEYVRAGA